MVDENEKRRIAQEVFAVTGQAVPENDALVLAALFYSRKLQDAARASADHINTSAASTRAVVDSAAVLVEKAMASNRLLVDAIEVRLKHAVRDASKVQSNQAGPPRGWRGVVAGIAFGVIATFGGIGVACNGSLSWISDAAIGHTVMLVYPTLNPGVKDELLEKVAKLAGH